MFIPPPMRCAAAFGAPALHIDLALPIYYGSTSRSFLRSARLSRRHGFAIIIVARPAFVGSAKTPRASSSDFISALDDFGAGRCWRPRDAAAKAPCRFTPSQKCHQLPWRRCRRELRHHFATRCRRRSIITTYRPHAPFRRRAGSLHDVIAPITGRLTAATMRILTRVDGEEKKLQGQRAGERAAQPTATCARYFADADACAASSADTPMPWAA